MKIFNVVLIFLFIVCAALQYNDPDPYVWMPVYLFGALLCYLAIKEDYRRPLFVSGLVIYSVYALYLVFADNGVIDWIRKHEFENIVQSMEPQKPWVEETREFFGLIILIISILINMLWLSDKSKTNRVDISAKRISKKI